MMAEVCATRPPKASNKNKNVEEFSLLVIFVRFRFQGTTGVDFWFVPNLRMMDDLDGGERAIKEVSMLARNLIEIIHSESFS